MSISKEKKDTYWTAFNILALCTSFGIWQNSVPAGVMMYFAISVLLDFLVEYEKIKKEEKKDDTSTTRSDDNLHM